MSFKLFNYCYLCISFRLILYFISYILIAKINVALQLTKLSLKKVTTTGKYFLSRSHCQAPKREMANVNFNSRWQRSLQGFGQHKTHA